MSVYSTATGWRYDFTLKGKRYTGSGLKTKKEAKRKEEARRREIELGEKCDWPIEIPRKWPTKFPTFET